jgi:hypothetical protein
MGQLITFKTRQNAQQPERGAVEELDRDGGLLRLDAAAARGNVFGAVDGIKQHIAKLDAAGVDTSEYSQRLDRFRGRLSIFNAICEPPVEPGGCALVSLRQLKDYEALARDLHELNDELAGATASYTNVVVLPFAARRSEA